MPEQVLLRGCRCVEIDVWDGKPEEEQPQNQSAPEHTNPDTGKKKGASGLLRSFSKRKSEPKASSSKTGEQSRSLRRRLGLKRKDSKEIKRMGSQSFEASNVDSDTSKSETYQMPGRWKGFDPDPPRVEPRVLHGYTLTKEVPFRKVCEAIRDSAFVTSDLPVIVSLELHASLEQQAIMVEIIKSAWRGLLVDDSTASVIDQQRTTNIVNKSHPLPAPANLKRKILIKVKYTPPEVAKKAQEEPGKTTPRPSSSSSSDDEKKSDANTTSSKKKAKGKKKKILDELSALGIYTQSFHFKDFNQPGQ